MYTYPQQAAAAAAAYGNYGAYSANPVSYPQQQIQAANSTTYSSAQYQYPSAASAYAQYGQGATQQQATANPAAAATAAAGFGSQLDYSAGKNFSEDYGYGNDYSNVYKNANSNAYGTIGTQPVGQQNTNAAIGISNSNNTAIGSGKQQNSANHYAGYEAAVYAAASSYLQARKTGTQSNWMKGGKRPGMGGVGIGAGVGNYPKKRYGLGHANREILNIYCEVCKISCAGQQTYKEHTEGKSHKKKEALQKGENKQSLPRNKVSFKCDVCDVTCTGRDTYDAHAKGSKHLKTVALLRKMNKPMPSLEPTVIPPKDPLPSKNISSKKVVGVTGTKFVTGTKLATTKPNGEEDNSDANSAVEQALLAESNVKPVGEEFIEEQRDSVGKLLQYSCKLCDCKFSDPNAKEIHLKGRRHRLQYKAKVNPQLQVEFKANNSNQWRKRDQGLHKDLFAQQMYLNQRGPPLHLQPFVNQWQHMSPTVYDNNDDRHVLAKDAAICPNKEDSEVIEDLILLVEKSLKGISDVFAAEEKDDKKVVTETPLLEEPERLLKGVMRVGLLAKNLLINTDNEVEVVVLCSKIPTASLLSRIVDLFPIHAEASAEKNLKIVQNTPESCFFVNIGKCMVTCRVTLTSVLVRETEKSADGTTTTAIESPVDALPIKSCLNALAELRRAKWFQVKCAPVQSSVITLRIIRDIGNRVKTWAPLSTWAMELLTEKTLVSIAIPLNPGEAVRRVFETIAAGVILSKNATLKDPCEKDNADVLANIKEQEREDITSSAQHALRLITFKQIYKILAIERIADPRPPVIPDRKRTLETSANDDHSSEVKKEKKDEQEIA